MAPGGSDTSPASTGWPRANPEIVTFESLHFFTAVAGVGSGSFTYRLYVNGVPTAAMLTVPLASTSGFVTGLAVVVDGDSYIEMTLQGTGELTSGAGRFTVVAGIAP